MSGDLRAVPGTGLDHEAAPRSGEGLYRYGVLLGYAAERLMDHEFPVTCICTCGRTIRKERPEGKWGHVEW